MKKQNDGEIISTNDVRIYISQLMKKFYTDTTISTEDAASLAAFSVCLDQFLKNSETEQPATQQFLQNLKKITWDNTKQMDPSFDRINENVFQKQSIVLTDGQKLISESGKYLYLGSILGSGGEGSVYKIPGMPGKAAKIYHSHVDRQEKERHVGAFLRNEVPVKVDNMLIAAIPEERIYTDNGEFIGYMMSLVSSQFKIFDVMRDSVERVRYFPELNYKGLIAIAYNLAEIVDTLHQHEIVIGDMNLGNIVVNTDGTACLIDTDSFDITDRISGERFPCSVGTPELLAPELQKEAQLSHRFTRETDYFSLAIIIFRLLMNNADPFGTVSFDEEISLDFSGSNEAIINGECPYVKSLDGKGIPLWAPDFETLPTEIRYLFHRVFSYSEQDYPEKIKDRPSAKEWMDALLNFYQSPMYHCEKNAFHWYRRELSECPFCKKERR